MAISSKLIVTGFAAACLVVVGYVSLNRRGSNSYERRKTLKTGSDTQSKDEFQSMVDEVSCSTNLQQGDMLLLYGLYKQATVGNMDESNMVVPSKLNVVAYAKYQAWKKFSGIPSGAAKLQYVEIAQLLLQDGGKGRSVNDDIVYENDNGEEDGSDYEGTGDYGAVSGLGSKPSTMAIPLGDNGMAHIQSDIVRAACARDQSMIEQLLSGEVQLDVNATDETGQTALHFLADHSDMTSVKRLIDAGADVNACDQDGISVLSVAVTVGDVDMCELLINAGASLDKADNDGETPIDISKSSGSKKLINLFEKSSLQHVERENPRKVKDLINQFDTPQMIKSSTVLQSSASAKETSNNTSKAVTPAFQPMKVIESKQRWADMEDSSDEDELLPMESVSVTASQLNDGFISGISSNNQVVFVEKVVINDSNIYGKMSDGDSSDEEPEVVVEENTLQSTDEKEESKASTIKPLSKKEKQALKAKELDDLDALLNEFGVLNSTDDAEEKKEEDALASGVATSKRRKKKNRKISSTLNTKSVDNLDTTIKLADVSIVMKAKSSKATKTKDLSAAAIAAKEIQKQKEINSKNKKKKKKPAYPKK